MEDKLIKIEFGTPADIDEMERLYNDLNDYLCANINYPGWIKGIYPIREHAIAGIKANNLFVVKSNGKIVASMILDHQPEEAYEGVNWKVEADYSHIFVLRTFVVHPSCLRIGIGRALIDFSSELAKKLGMRSIRLDVYEQNLPAISLYEKCGFCYVDTVDLGFSNYGLNWFKLYEKAIFPLEVKAVGKQVMMITEKQILTDPQLPPTTELLQQVMRDNYANFERLLTLFDKQGITTEWNYYKDGKSWLGKAQRH